MTIETAVNTPTIEVSAVAPIPHAGGLQGQSLETPRDGHTEDGHVLTITGWVYAAASPVVRVQVRSGGRVLTAVEPAFPRPDVAVHLSAPEDANVGFLATIGALELPTSFALTLVAERADGTEVPFMAIEGSRAPLRPRHRAALQPIFVTNIGRVGSTVLMNLLRCHPRIVVHDLYPYETRSLGYWMHMLRVLSGPADHANSANPNRYEDDQHWVGRHPHNMRPVVDPEPINRWFRGDYVDELAAFCQSSAEGFYASVAEAQGVEDPLYFAEKRNPRSTARLASELYPDGRELFLVRDPRDMVCSMLSFYEKTRLVSFGRDATGDDEEFVRLIAPALHDLVAQMGERADRSLVVRYEDLVGTPAAVLDSILDYLQLDTGAAQQAEIVKRAFADTQSSRRHRTTAAGNSSVGRWRRELSESMQAACAVAFGELLPALGYPA